ncbi:hypothetical protein COB28_04795 [Candidatus Dependentiae bacterium]|nr:MAG: hypothetical protein COB28_04795 [Candidatus Dependentiae bacterium]
MTKIKEKIILIFLFLPCILLGQIKDQQEEIIKHPTLQKSAQTITLKTLSTRRIERLVDHYSRYIQTKRTSELLQGATKTGLIGTIVSLLYHFTEEEIVDDLQNVKLNIVKRVYDQVIIGTFLLLLTGGLHSAMNNFSYAWENKAAKKCSNNLLRRLLFELRHYKNLIISLNEETPFISDYQMVTTYNQIISSLEHTIAWKHAQTLEPHKKVVYDSIENLTGALEEYKELLIETRKNNWSQKQREKLVSYTHSFLYPWIALITPEVSYE